MRNLLFLIKQYYSFFIFLGLELVCFIIVFKNNHFQQASYINSSRKISGLFYHQKSKLTDYLHLREMNDSLLSENATLKQKLGLQILQNAYPDSSYSQTSHRDSVTQTIHYNYVPAKVLNNTIDQKINYLTLNVGSLQGIKKNMAVINQHGIVGRISHVSPNYSVALSLLSDRFIVSAMVADGTVGKLSWDGADADLATLSGIPQSVKLKPLDSVYTSGYGIFPEKIAIGRAVKVLSGTSYLVWLSSNFRKLHFVYVIKEEINIERKVLEDSTTVDPKP